MRYFLGIDVGTSGTRAVLINPSGKLKADATVEYGMDTPRPGWAEQDPHEWWQATKKAIRGALKKAGIPGRDVQGIGLTGQMHSSVFLDKDFNVIRPALLWCDSRTGAECDEIQERAGGVRSLVRLSANRALTGFTAPKILWLRNIEPKNYQRLRHLLLSKDYIRFKLTGELATEVSDASGMLLFDVKNRRWSKRLLELLEIDPSILPACYESTEITGKVTKKASRDTGLALGTPVVGGGGDQAAGAVGNGIVKEGPILITIGTSGVVFSASRKPLIDPEARLHSFCHASPGLWHTMGVMLSAGGSMQWLRNRFRELDEGIMYPAMTKMAERVPVGSDDLMFLPYLTGERTPVFDPDARGAFVGLSLSHDMGHLVRAVMEGVTFGLKDSVELMKEVGTRVSTVYLSGGGARSRLWSQMVADIINRPIRKLAVDQGPGFGAALLAAVGVGVFKNTAEAAAATLRLKPRHAGGEILPNKRNAKVYHELYQRYCSIYPALKNIT
jgi:xylulokinase